ncbi:hypothetical protein HN803_06785 [candidate division WWE3 bacterium]|jgi:hypothetical protein|nr:hypothetical protein [candidate division WWE3 bacterium]MBT7350457.1 hypothetical protein [candidate division WWE3 bacterium]
MNRYGQQLKDTESLQIKKIPLKDAEKVEENDLQDAVVEIRFLALSWLDDFEKDLFEGKTVGELLDHNKYV